MASGEPTPVESGDAAGETLADARWFPLRFNEQTDEFHFAFIPAGMHRDIAFLRDLRPTATEIRIVHRSALHEAGAGAADLHVILHSGLGGSTLLARALAQPGIATALQEPPILTDVIAYGLTRPRSEIELLLGQVTRLFRRPFSAGEAVVCKMSNVGDGLGASIATIHPTSQILCLQTPLDEMLSSFASRGIEGRFAARKLFISMRNARMHAIDLSDRELVEHTDLQLAALGWLSMQKIMVDAATLLGADRVGSVLTGQLMAGTGDVLRAAARHFRLDLDIEARMAEGLFDRHSKTGEPFNAQQRVERVAERLRAHGREIGPVVQWTRKVAEAAGIAWDLPHHLLR